jgi:hypothetical protein
MASRNILLGVIAGLFLVCTLSCGAAILSAQTTNRSGANRASCTVPNDEIAALDAIHAGTYYNPEVIVTETQQWTLPDLINLQLAAKGQGLPPDLRKDFEEKNRSSCKIVPFISNRNVHFVSAAEERKIFQIGWNEFYRRYGKNAGIEEISRVGFNFDKTLALVHLSGALGATGAAGTLFLLQRIHKKWAIKFTMEIEAV